MHIGATKIQYTPPYCYFHLYCASITVYSGGELDELFVMKYIK